MTPINPRVDTDTCVRCRKKFLRGDRVQMAHIIAYVGRNPDAGNAIGAFVSDEFEFTHIDCVDATLSGKVIGL